MGGAMFDQSIYQIKMLLKYNKDGNQGVRETQLQNLFRFINHIQKHQGYSKHWELSKIGKKELQ